MFHVGQMVECVDDKAYPQTATHPFGGQWGVGPVLVRRGAIYTVEAVNIHPATKCLLLLLAGVPLRPHGSNWPDLGWNARRFRPLQDSKLEVFRALLVDLPAPPKFEPTKERV